MGMGMAGRSAAEPPADPPDWDAVLPWVIPAARNQPPSAGPAPVITAISQSGQFVVTGSPPRTRRPVETRSSGQSLRDMTPQTLVVSCERVKSEILRQLELPDQWRAGGGRTGKILVGIDANVRTNSPLAVEASPFENGWHIRLTVPTEVSEDRLVRALTQAIVLELASRAGNQRAGEPPLWLIEGLTQLVLASSPDGVILQPQTRTVADLRPAEKLAPVRAQLARRPPLAFHQLSQPELSRMDARDWELYAACAHLCVRELSRLPDGTPRLARWIVNLQRHWNWQTGFLEAFQPAFRSLLDVEKWWALTLANFTGRSPSQAWPEEFALRKLEEALQPVGVLPGAGRGPSRLRLEEVIESWEFARQLPVLRQFLRQLQAIRLNAPATVSPLAYRYGDVIEEYLTSRSRAGYAPPIRSQPQPSVRLLVRETLGRLRELDGERARLTAELAAPSAPASATAGAVSPSR